MRYLKILTLILGIGIIYGAASDQGYCFFRDDMDHSEIIREIEEKKQESRDSFRENQKEKELEQKEKIKNQELAVQKKKEAQELPEPKPEPKKGIIFFLILCLGLGGYLLYRHKNK